MRLIWLSYFDPRKDSKRVWWRSKDLTDTRMATPCRDRGTPRMKCPLKGRLYEFFHNSISYLTPKYQAQI